MKVIFFRIMMLIWARMLERKLSGSVRNQNFTRVSLKENLYHCHRDGASEVRIALYRQEAVWIGDYRSTKRREDKEALPSFLIDCFSSLLHRPRPVNRNFLTDNPRNTSPDPRIAPWISYSTHAFTHSSHASFFSFFFKSFHLTIYSYILGQQFLWNYEQFLCRGTRNNCRPYKCLLRPLHQVPIEALSFSHI